MRIYALELDNEIKGISERKKYIESLISRLDSPDFVVLPELAICSYMACQDVWQYADDCGKDCAKWALEIALKYDTYIGVGYLDKEAGDYYNRYMIVGPKGYCGTVTKSEGETAVFKNGKFDNVISTPMGNVGVAICYDSKRKNFYNNVKDKELSLILFPHGCPADPKKPEEESRNNEFFCGTYASAFHVPVVYANCKGKLEYMPGKMGAMMERAGFRMNGKSKIYGSSCVSIDSEVSEAICCDVKLYPHKLSEEIKFYGEDLVKGNFFFRKFILKPDAKAGIKMYEKAISHR